MSISGSVVEERNASPWILSALTVPKLLVHNATGEIGLVGYWDCVAFDEFVGKPKRVDKALVDIRKNYMASKSFSRGIETLGAEASMVFVGNTQHTVPDMLKHSDLFEELPDKFYDSVFLDRIHKTFSGLMKIPFPDGERILSGEGLGIVGCHTGRFWKTANECEIESQGSG